MNRPEDTILSIPYPGNTMSNLPRPTTRDYLAAIAKILGEQQGLPKTLRIHAEDLYAQGFPADEAVQCLQIPSPTSDR